MDTKNETYIYMWRFRNGENKFPMTIHPCQSNESAQSLAEKIWQDAQIQFGEHPTSAFNNVDIWIITPEGEKIPEAKKEIISLHKENVYQFVHWMYLESRKKDLQPA